MLRVALAPVGAGKTETALNALTAVLQKQRFARVWVLLATRRQEDAFRQRLIELDDGRNLYFNVEFFDFYGLYRRLLNVAQQPARGLADAARFGLLRQVILDLNNRGELQIYSKIASTPGFLRIVAELIFELKQNRVEPAVFLDAAQSRKDYELATIYGNYQQLLQEYYLVDKEGEGWLALEQLENLEPGHLALDLLIVDGFDQFTVVQARLLQGLSRLAADTLVTLTTVPEREDTVGRRFQRALDTLQSDNFPVEIERLFGAHERHPDLQHLGESIFRAQPTLRAATDGVTLIEAPDAAGEVAAVLRQVKRLLLNGHAPDGILIALRDWTRYQPHFTALAQEYRIPLALHYGDKLTENPAITTLFKLLELPIYDFRRRDLLDVLRSPYIQAAGLDETQIAWLERVSQKFTVTGGEDVWLDAIERATRNTWDEEGDPVEPLLDEFTEANLSFALGEFFRGITPPAEATIDDYVGWLENLLGADPAATPDDDLAAEFADEQAYSIQLIEGIRAGDEATRARDLVALQEFKQVLRGLLAAQELLKWMRQAQTDAIPWEEFYGQLKSAVDHAEVNPQPNRGGRVLVTSAANARGLPHDYVFVLGLSEGIFPAPVPEDPLYLDSERRTLIQRGVLLRTAAERATDDGLFYELISLPRLSLTLTRPTAHDGQPWTESHLWRATRAVFDRVPIQRLRAGEVVAPGDAASLAEVALAVADSLTNDTVSTEVAGLYNWLLYHQRDYWVHLRTAQRVETQRLTRRQTFDQYSGKLSDPRLVENVTRTLDNRLWSASQFNDYGACPFRFFANRLLKLEALKTPEAGMDVLQTGSLNHQLLERTYETLREEGLSIVPEHTDVALEILQEVAPEILATAPERYGFRPTRLWEQEQKTLLERLKRLVMLDFSPDNPIAKAFPGEERRPYQLEAPFGRDGGVDVVLDLGDSGRLKLNGYIDRIDRVGDGLVIIDYKTGSTKFKVEDMREGRNFQMIVYLLAARQLIAADPDPYAPRDVLGGLFWHIRRGEISGVLQHPHTDEVTNEALEHLDRYVGLMRTGDFAVAPGKASEGKCVSYCEYRQLCRLCGL